MYSDYIQKLEYYKQRAIEQLVRYGIPLNTGNIERELVGIDLSISILNQRLVENDETFNVAAYNTMLTEIMKDLEILYRIINEEIIDQLNSSRRRGLASLNDLQRTAQQQLSKMKAETNAGFIGTNIVSNTADFEMYKTNEYLNVDMGEFEVPSGTYLALIADVDNNDEDIQLVLNYEDTTVHLPPYATTNQNVTQVGAPKVSTYDIELDKDAQFDMGSYIMHDKTVMNTGSTYRVLSQKSSYKTIYEDGSVSFTPFVSQSNYVDGVTVSMYVKDATFIRFIFAHEPDVKSFANNGIENIDDLMYFEFSYSKDTVNDNLTFELQTDGTIYGQGELGIVDDEGLYLTEPYDAMSYTVIEEHLGDPISCSALVKIKDGAPEKVHGLFIRKVGDEV